MFHRKFVTISIMLSGGYTFTDRCIGSASVDLHTAASGPVMHNLPLRTGGHDTGRIVFAVEMEQFCTTTLTLKYVTLSPVPMIDNLPPTTQLSYRFSGVNGKPVWSTKCRDTTSAEWSTLEPIKVSGSIRELFGECINIDIYVNNKLRSQPKRIAAPIKLPIELFHSFTNNQIITVPQTIQFMNDTVNNQHITENGTLYVHMYWTDFPSFAQMVGGIHTEKGISQDARTFARGVAMPLFNGTPHKPLLEPPPADIDAIIRSLGIPPDRWEVARFTLLHQYKIQEQTPKQAAPELPKQFFYQPASPSQVENVNDGSYVLITSQFASVRFHHDKDDANAREILSVTPVPPTPVPPPPTPPNPTQEAQPTLQLSPLQSKQRTPSPKIIPVQPQSLPIPLPIPRRRSFDDEKDLPPASVLSAQQSQGMPVTNATAPFMTPQQQQRVKPGTRGFCVVCDKPADYVCRTMKTPVCSVACKQEQLRRNDMSEETVQSAALTPRASLYPIPQMSPNTSASAHAPVGMPGLSGHCIECGNGSSYLCSITNVPVCSSACKEAHLVRLNHPESLAARAARANGVATVSSVSSIPASDSFNIAPTVANTLRNHKTVRLRTSLAPAGDVSSYSASAASSQAPSQSVSKSTSPLVAPAAALTVPSPSATSITANTTDAAATDSHRPQPTVADSADK